MTTKKLEIDNSRLCECKASHINCDTAKNWLKSQIGVWEFTYEKRDIRDKSLHPATFPISLARKFIDLFSHRGELILDPFMGSGTVLVAAKDAERNAVGFDIYQKYVDLTNERLAQATLTPSTRQIAVLDDARNIPEYLKEETLKLSITSPPFVQLLNRKRKYKSQKDSSKRQERYMKVDRYGRDDRDLGTYSLDKYRETITEIYSRILPLTKVKGHAVINVTDYWWENKRIPLHIYIIKAMEAAGFELRNTIIWDRRKLVNRVGIFGYPNNYITMGVTFEYLLHFWRPP